MTMAFSGRTLGLIAVAFVVALSPLVTGQTEKLDELMRRTLTFRGAEREYFVKLPPGFDRSKTYWPLVTVHGGGGNGRAFFMVGAVARAVADLGLDAIVISPSFTNEDGNASRFPPLGEGAFLEEVLEELRRDYRLRAKMLLTGYSRGGQFTHRFALAHPEQVAAVAPLASGTWTTPDGRFLAEGAGEIRDARAFLSNAGNISKLPDRLRDLFEARVASVAETKALAHAREVPFLVMCGTLDPRLSIAKDFVSSLQGLGYKVDVDWPRTPHSCTDDACRKEHGSEFEKYSRRTVEFFQRVARGQ